MVQVIPKAAIKQESAIKKILPWLSFLLILIIVGVYFILKNEINRTEVAIKQTKQELSKIQTKEQSALEKKILTFKTKVDDAIQLLQNREKSSNIFGFLETFIHPNIYFTSLSSSMGQGTLELQGISKRFADIGQQISVFKQDPFIKEATLSNIDFSEEGEIEFSIEILLSSEDTSKENLQ
jgi:Tfp pilus assembly protein PilN